MFLILGLIVAALVLAFFEVLLPGGILGLAAAVCVLAATWYAFALYGTLSAAGVFLGALACAGLMIYLEFRYLSRTDYGKKFFLRDAVEGHTREGGEENLVGKRGKALTRLNPSGMVLVDGVRHEGFSQDGYIDAGAEVEVVGTGNFKLIIRKS